MAEAGSCNCRLLLSPPPLEVVMAEDASLFPFEGLKIEKTMTLLAHCCNGCKIALSTVSATGGCHDEVRTACAFFADLLTSVTSVTNTLV
jgi:hypothetical protein